MYSVRGLKQVGPSPPHGLGPRWARRVRAQEWDEAFVFFKHEEEGAGPALAADFLEVAERAE